MPTNPIQRSDIRRLIDRIFPTDADLQAFTLDHFPYIYNSFSDGMDRISKVNRLLEGADPAEILRRIQDFSNDEDIHTILRSWGRGKLEVPNRNPHAYHATRKRLLDDLPMDAEFEAFLIDFFPRVHQRLSNHASRHEKINLLLTLTDPAEVNAKLDILHGIPPHGNTLRIIERLSQYFFEIREWLSKLFSVWRRLVFRDTPSTLTLGPRNDRESERYRPFHLLALYSDADRDAWFRLGNLLREKEKQDIVQLIGCEVHVQPLDTVSSQIDWADIVIFMVSPELLISHDLSRILDYALKRREEGVSQVLPIMIRPSAIRRFKFSELPILPSSGGPLSEWLDPTEGWKQIGQEIGVALDYMPTRAVDPKQQPAAIPPRRPLKLGQIFCTSGVPSETYAEPREFSRLLALIEQPGQGLAVEGPSGIGKTTAVQKALGKASAEWIRCLEKEKVVRLDKLLKDIIRAYLVIDDFHYLEESRKRQIAYKIKIMADSGEPGKIILIGVNDVRTSLVRLLPDLGANRVISVRIGAQTYKELSIVLTQGEKRANIEFRHRAEIINAAHGSFSILQQLCFNLAADAGVTETLLVTKVIAQGLPEILPQMREHLVGDFREPLRYLAVHDAVVPPRGAMVVLLWLLRDAQDGIVSFEEARLSYPFLAPAFDWLLDGNLLKAILQIQERFQYLQRLVYFDAQAGTLTVEDPRLLFYLRYQDWDQFIKETGVRTLKLDECGRLVRMLDEGSTNDVGKPRRSRRLTRGSEDIPATLRKALADGQVVPLAGAGILATVMRRTTGGSRLERLLPCWAELLEIAAQRLEQEHRLGDALVVRGAIQKTVPSYLDAARYAREGLGPLWYPFLKELLDPAYERVDPGTLAVPESLWRLGSRLVITTNYDRVLRWSYPEEGRNNLREWHVEASAELSQMLRSGVNEPTIWYLHGSIDDAANMIVTPDGYNQLYPASDRDGVRYKAALRVFQTLVASRTLLFVGFSGKEDPIWDQLRWVESVFSEAAGPHYIALSEDDYTGVQDRIRSIRCLHPLVYKSNLVDFLHTLEP